MKILYLHPNAWSGEYAVLSKLQQLGHEICVLEESRQLPTARQRRDFFKHEDDGMATWWYHPGKGWAKLLTLIHDRYWRKAFDGRNLYHRIWEILSAVKHFSPDVIIASDGFSYAIPAAIARKNHWLQVPLVTTCIGGDILDCYDVGVGRRRTEKVNRLIQYMVAHSDYLRPTCQHLAQVLLQEGASADKISVIYTHLTADWQQLSEVLTHKAEYAKAMRKRYAVPEQAFVLGTLSGNEQGKGGHILATLWKDIAQRYPHVYWLLCGPSSAWFKEQVMPRLEQSGYLDRVIFTDKLAGKAVFEHLGAMDLHINPTLCEGMNMVTVEAAAVGTATLSTDGAGIADFIQQYQAGLVVPAADAQALSQAITMTLDDTQQIKTWQSNCPSMAQAFALHDIADQLATLCDRVKYQGLS